VVRVPVTITACTSAPSVAALATHARVNELSSATTLVQSREHACQDIPRSNHLDEPIRHLIPLFEVFMDRMTCCDRSTLPIPCLVCCDRDALIRGRQGEGLAGVGISHL